MDLLNILKLCQYNSRKLCISMDTCCLLDYFACLGVNQVMRDLALLICDPLVYLSYLCCVRPLGPLLGFYTLISLL